jgi:hypothetical protein
MLRAWNLETAMDATAIVSGLVAPSALARAERLDMVALLLERSSADLLQHEKRHGDATDRRVIHDSPMRPDSAMPGI